MSKVKVLVVEDTDLIRNTLSLRLQKEGHEVDAVGSVNKALHAIRTKMPDLIVLDLHLVDHEDPLPGLTDGFAVVRMLRLNYPEANPGVIIYTVTRTADVQSQAQSMGVSTVIEKKSGILPVLTAIREALTPKGGGQKDTPAAA